MLVFTDPRYKSLRTVWLLTADSTKTVQMAVELAYEGDALLRV